MRLADVITNVAHKELAQVEIDGRLSNQHELNGSATLREFFGTSEKTEELASWHYFEDDQEPLRAEDSITFYDARANDPDRTEWRLYYPAQAALILHRASPGDIFILVRTNTQKLYGLVFQRGSAWLRAASVLFGLEDIVTSNWVVSGDSLTDQSLGIVQQQILDELNLDVSIPTISSDEDLVLESFDHTFPSTSTMSEFARTQVLVDLDDPDETLLRWINREEELFRALEKLVLQDTIERGFDSVDHFISVSLSVQNRRKSRMGWAFTHHLDALWQAYNLRYSREQTTEDKYRPDFVFPGIEEYQDPNFDADLLTMLAAKSTCKDRWRQILPEAKRIPIKHLCTLETSISEAQTAQMDSENVVLVVPKSLHNTYSQTQLQAGILTVDEFIQTVKLNSERG